MYSYNIIDNNINNFDGSTKTELSFEIKNDNNKKPKVIGDNSNVEEKNSIESNEDAKFDPNNIKIKNTDNFYL